MRALGVLVPKSHTEEFGWVERHVRFHCPFAARIDGELRRVVPYPETPAAPWLRFDPGVPAEPVTRRFLTEIVLDASDRVDPFRADGEQRMQPALGPPLVLEV